ncbi:MAG: SLC13 family permease, partial [Nanoarchaeota archaeon]|nr:SLC13 family permease [Nanoarchaeota archaeon]
MLNPQLVAVVIFVATYLFLMRFYERKQVIVWFGVLALALLGVLPWAGMAGAVDWNVILLYFGMLFVSEVFLYSRMPDFLATIFASKCKNTAQAMLVICAFTGLLSIFLENVAVVLLVAPIALSISRKCEINPVPLFVGIAISSNLQGAGTLIGDPPSMLLGGFAGLSFNDFFFLNGNPSIFFAVQIGALASLCVLALFFMRGRHDLPRLEKQSFVSVWPTLFVIGLILALIFTSPLQTEVPLAGLLCVLFGVISYAWYAAHSKDRKFGSYVGRLDWKTGLFLMGVFILVDSLRVTGVIGQIANLITGLSGGGVGKSFFLLVWLSVLISAFIDNVPFLVVMLPVTQAVIASTGAPPPLLYFGLLIGASVGGNITPIGASA